MAVGPAAAGRLQDAFGSPSAALVAGAVLLAAMVPLVALFWSMSKRSECRASSRPRSEAARGVRSGASRRQRLRDRIQRLHRVVGIEFDLQSALAAIEEHGCVRRVLPLRSRSARASSARTARCRRHDSRSAVRHPAGRIIFAALPPKAAASFFMLTSLSDGTTTQTGLPSTSAISVFSMRRGSTPSASAACRPMLWRRDRRRRYGARISRRAFPAPWSRGWFWTCVQSYSELTRRAAGRPRRGHKFSGDINGLEALLRPLILPSCLPREPLPLSGWAACMRTAPAVIWAGQAYP